MQMPLQHNGLMLVVQLDLLLLMPRAVQPQYSMGK